MQVVQAYFLLGALAKIGDVVKIIPVSVVLRLESSAFLCEVVFYPYKYSFRGEGQEHQKDEQKVKANYNPCQSENRYHVGDDSPDRSHRACEVCGASG